MKKASYININFLKKYYFLKNIKNFDRNINLFPNIVGTFYKTYNGISFVKLLVSKQIVGHKFGEFCYTRASYCFKRKTKLKQIKQKKSTK